MTNGEDKAMVASQGVVFGELRKHWGWLLLLGILFIVLGSIGLGMVFGLTLVSVLFFGILMVVGGCLQLINAFKCKGWKSIFWHMLMALFYIFAGIIVIGDPVLASTIFTAMLAIAFICVGLVRVIMAVQLRGAKGWVWPLITGIVSILLGGVILAQWPISGLWVIGLFVSVEMIIHGWSYIIVALAARSTE